MIKAVAELFATALGALGFVGRTRRRAAIREDLKLLSSLEKFDHLGPDTAAHLFLVQHITLDVADYSGALETKGKRPWSSSVVAIVIGVPLAYWTYKLNVHGFEWLSIFPGAFGFLMLLGGIGMLFEKPEIPEESESRMQAGLARLRAELERRDAEWDDDDEPGGPELSK